MSKPKRNSEFVLLITDTKGATRVQIREIVCANQGSFRECIYEATDFAHCNPGSEVKLICKVHSEDSRTYWPYELFRMKYNRLPKSCVDDLQRTPLTDSEISDLIADNFKRK